VAEDKKPQLIKFLLKKFKPLGKTSESAISMPLDKDNKSEGYVLTVFVCSLLI
jgi:hypothetical protein